MQAYKVGSFVFDIVRFYIIDVLFVWGEIGQTKFSTSGYASRCSSRIKAQDRLSVHRCSSSSKTNKSR